MNTDPATHKHTDQKQHESLKENNRYIPKQAGENRVQGIKDP